MTNKNFSGEYLVIVKGYGHFFCADLEEMTTECEQLELDGFEFDVWGVEDYQAQIYLEDYYGLDD